MYDILNFLLWSVLVGLGISAPIGPISLLAIQKTLEDGVCSGMLIGLSNSLVNIVFALIAVLGLSAISTFLVEQMLFIQLIGGLFLIYLGYKEYKNVKQSAQNNNLKLARTSYFQLMFKIALLTLSNPITVIGFISLFSILECNKLSIGESASIIFGIFLGSMVWWSILVLIVKKLQSKISQLWLARIKIISAGILFILGLLIVIRSYYCYLTS